ncbi:hypothetical protein ACE6H2_016946 [Prunus campanulata]
MIRIVLLARDSTIGLKDLRAQLLNAERQAEIHMHALSHSMNAMMATPASSQPNSARQILVVQNIFLKVPAQLKVLAPNLIMVTMVPSFDLLLSLASSSHVDIMFSILFRQAWF